MIRLAHLSDIHFGGENVAAVAGAARVLNAGGFDLTIVSGDLTQFGEIGEFEAAAAWLASVPGPQLVCPGNHDAPYLAWWERFFSPFGRFARIIGPAETQTFKAPGLAVHGLNTARGVQPRANWSKGQISQAQTRTALRWLAGAPREALKVVVVHHPLVEMIGGPMTGKVWGGEAAAQALAEGGVDLVLSGHIHAPFVWPYPFGDGCAQAVGAGTLSVRERGVAPSFNIIEADEAEIRVVAHSWKGSRYEPMRTWAVERRQQNARPG
ncbi:metallophosphoesterase [Phenylobacterium sp. Root77]|uniref:metallophosphoesterase family protein n=1 Tax=unclassified Phenylobacterium TaxID=2640670 RepID=UPI000B1B9DEE